MRASASGVTDSSQPENLITDDEDEKEEEEGEVEEEEESEEEEENEVGDQEESEEKESEDEEESEETDNLELSEERDDLILDATPDLEFTLDEIQNVRQRQTISPIVCIQRRSSRISLSLSNRLSNCLSSIQGRLDDSGTKKSSNNREMFEETIYHQLADWLYAVKKVSI